MQSVLETLKYKNHREWEKLSESESDCDRQVNFIVHRYCVVTKQNRFDAMLYAVQLHVWLLLACVQSTTKHLRLLLVTTYFVDIKAT